VLRRVKRGALGATLVALAVAVPVPVRATWCDFEQTTGHDVMPGATVINVYWSPNWDAGAPPELTRAAIDSITQALVDSDYFQSASDNYGSAAHPTFGGSIQYSTIAAPAGPVDVFFMSNVVNDALRNPAVANLPSPLVNLFVPTGTFPRNLVNKDCTNSNLTALHNKANLSNTPFTAISVDPACTDL